MDIGVTDLACARGGKLLLEGVNFTLQPGGAIILRGPNGIGKTTLLRTLAGLQPSAAGEIRAPAEMLVFGGHSDGIKAMLSVVENLQFWAEIFGGKEGVGPALAAFDLTALADRGARTLSAGQKRRLGLARLLVTGRPVWLLDEPTVSLDAASTRLFARAVSHHLQQGGSALIATHIDLGLEAEVLDLSPYRVTTARGSLPGGFDEAFA